MSSQASSPHSAVREFKILNKYGIHARPAALFVKTVSRFQSEVTVERDNLVAAGKSIMGLLTLEGYQGSVLKVTANERTYRCMEDNMDADLSAIVRGEKTYQQAGRELVDAIAATANGRLTKAEAFGFSDIAVDHVCRYV